MKPYFKSKTFRLYQGDCLDVLPCLKAKSVHCCVTSPPYWNLRSYGNVKWEGGDVSCDHDKEVHNRAAMRVGTKGDQNKIEQQIHAKSAKIMSCRCGAIRSSKELGSEQSVDEYVELMRQVFSEVRRVLRDDGTLWLNLGDSYAQAKGHGHWENRGDKGDENRQKTTKRWADMGAECIGLKPKDLIGVPWRVAFALQADGWYLRQDIIWAKPNPLPSPVKDRFVSSHEHIFLLSKSRKYYFDHDKVREVAEGTHTATKLKHRRYQDRNNTSTLDSGSFDIRTKRDVWSVPTASGRRDRDGEHFAVYPVNLIRPCIEAGCPKGGWVLDPFMGSGTTAVVAKKYNRRCVGIELNEIYCASSVRRWKRKKSRSDFGL